MFGSPTQPSSSQTYPQGQAQGQPQAGFQGGVDPVTAMAMNGSTMMTATSQGSTARAHRVTKAVFYFATVVAVAVLIGGLLSSSWIISRNSVVEINYGPFESCVGLVSSQTCTSISESDLSNLPDNCAYYNGTGLDLRFDNSGCEDAVAAWRPMRAFPIIAIILLVSSFVCKLVTMDPERQDRIIFACHISALLCIIATLISMSSWKSGLNSYISSNPSQPYYLGEFTTSFASAFGGAPIAFVAISLFAKFGERRLRREGLMGMARNRGMF